VERGVLARNPVRDSVAAVSVGIVKGAVVLDLPYEEDSIADVDMNVVVTGAGQFVEVQGTAEHAAFSRGELTQLTDLALQGTAELARLQLRAVAGAAG
jgi:ribonuclease PH